MKFRLAIFVLFLALGLSHAQIGADLDLHPHLSGAAGFDFLQHSYRTQTSTWSTDPSRTTSVMGNVRMSGTGYLTEFVNVSGDFSTGKGNTYSTTDSSNYNWSGGLATTIFQQSPIPFRAYWRKFSSSLDLPASASDSDAHSYGFNWMLRLKRLPQFQVDYSNDDNSTLTPLSFSDSDYTRRAWNVYSDYSLFGFRLNGRWNTNDSDTKTIFRSVLAPEIQTNSTGWNAALSRKFGVVNWNTLAARTKTNIEQSDGNIANNDLLHYSTSANTPIGKRLTTTLNYSFMDQEFHNSGPGNSFGILPSTMQQHSGTAVVTAALFKGVTFTQSAQVIRYDFPSSFEYGTSFVRTSSTVAVQRRIKEVDVNGNYSLLYDRIGSSLDHHGSAFSNNYGLHFTWGDVRHLRWNVGHDRLSNRLVQEIGGFSNDSSWDLRVETTRFALLQSEAGIRYTSGEILNSNGKLNRKGTMLFAGATGPKMSFRVSRSFNSGNGLLYPGELTYRKSFITALPDSAYLLIPAIASDSGSWMLDGMYRLRPELEFRGSWQRQHITYSGYDQSLRTIDVSGRYTAGRLIFEAGMGRYLDNLVLPSGVKNLGNRMYVRISRDFRLF